MNTIKSFFLLFLVSVFTQSLNAQSKNEAKWQRTIDAINQTEFVKRYKENKSHIEAYMAEFKANQDEYDARDVSEIKKGYDQTVIQFNQILTEMQNGFIEPRTRKYLENNPDTYTRFMQAKLDDAVDYYEKNCQNKIELLSNSAAFGLMEIQLIIGLGTEMWKMIDRHKQNVKKISGEYFERNFIHPLQLKNWDNL